jgi:hypothetical protein
MSVYFAQDGNDGPVKIGHASNPRERLSQIQCGNPRPVRARSDFSGDDHIAIELAIDRARQMLLDPSLDFATRKRSKAFLDAARAEGFV